MNQSRSSILRWMASVALIASALAFLRSGTTDEFLLGELAPFSTIGLLGMALALITRGHLRRFFAGLAATGVLVGLIFWLGPHWVRSFVLERMLIPIDARLAPHPANDGMTRLTVSLMTLYRLDPSSEPRGI